MEILNFNSLIKTMTLASAVLCFSYEIHASTVAVASMSASKGNLEGSLNNLATRDNTLVNLYSNNRARITANFIFSTIGLGANLNLIGQFKQNTLKDIFKFQVLSSSGVYVDIGSTTGISGFKSLQFKLPEGASINGKLSIRITSSAADDSALDYLALDDAKSAPIPPSIPIPTPPTPPTGPAPYVGSIPAGTSWYWQLQGVVPTTNVAKVYDIDLYDNTAANFATLKALGKTVICYFSAGTYEPNRPDSALIPAAGIGSSVAGWPGEKWLDVRNAGVRQIMSKRLELAKSKGCDGVEPDNVDGYSNNSGFPLTAQDQINFNIFLANEAHLKGLLVGLKNSTDLVSALVNKFDFAVVEECFKYKECPAYSPFIAQNKAVLNAEYTTFSNATCDTARSLNFSTTFYNLDLNGKVVKPCL
jgi:hypothetical protein